MAKINVTGTEVTIVSIEEKDYISLTDMVRNVENGLALVEKWLRNKNTIEFISPEFEGIGNVQSQF
jgi:hypothetical protein